MVGGDVLGFHGYFVGTGAFSSFNIFEKTRKIELTAAFHG